MTGYLGIEAAIYQSMGQFDKAIEVAQKSLLLSPETYDAAFVEILSLYAMGNVVAARDAVSKLHEDTPAVFKPTSTWNEPFPQALAERISLESGDQLQVMSYEQGIQAVVDQLGWKTKQEGK